MNHFLNGKSSWGHRVDEIDPLAIKRLNRFLKSLSNTGENICILFTFILMITITALLLTTNFENVIFFDGTTDLCIFSSKTGEVIHVNSK